MISRSTPGSTTGSRGLLPWVIINVVAWSGLTIAWMLSTGFRSHQAFSVDAWTYLFPAFQALEGGGFDSGKRPFFYPLYLLLNFRLGIGTHGVVIQQLFAVALAAGLVAYPLARAAGRWLGFILVPLFVGLVVTWPMLNVYAHLYASEVAYALALSLFVAFAVWFFARCRPASWNSFTVAVTALAVVVFSFLPLWIKSHWYVGAWLSLLILGSVLIYRLVEARRRPWAALAVLVFATWGGTLMTGALENSAVKREFGLRSIFCNHYPILRNYWQTSPSILAFLDERSLATLDRRMAHGLMVGKPRNSARNWTHLGYNAAWCMLNHRGLEQAIPSRATREAFQMANARVLLTRALPDYIGKVTGQMGVALLDPLRVQRAMESKRLFRRKGDELATYAPWPERLGLVYPGHSRGTRPIGWRVLDVFTLKPALTVLFLLGVLRLGISAALRGFAGGAVREARPNRALADVGFVMLGVFLAHAVFVAATHTFDVGRYLAPVQPLVMGIGLIGLLMLANDARRLAGKRRSSDDRFVDVEG